MQQLVLVAGHASQKHSAVSHNVHRLAHCSAGRFAPEYSWQQAEMPYCSEGWADGTWTTGPNQACFCPEDSWRSMTVVRTRVCVSDTNGLCMCVAVYVHV